jgi:hypothetical protein
LESSGTGWHGVTSIRGRTNAEPQFPFRLDASALIEALL